MTRPIRPHGDTAPAATPPRAVVLRRFTVAVRAGRTPHATILVQRRGASPVASAPRRQRGAER